MELKYKGLLAGIMFAAFSQSASAGWYCQTQEGNFPMPNAIPQQGRPCSGPSSYGRYQIGGSTVWINQGRGYQGAGRGGYNGGGYQGNRRGGGISHQRRQDIQKATMCGTDPSCWAAMTLQQELAEGDIIENTVDNVERAIKDIGGLIGF